MFPPGFPSVDVLICHKKLNLSTLDRKEKECYLKPVDFWVVCLNVHMFRCSSRSFRIETDCEQLDKIDKTIIFLNSIIRKFNNSVISK